MGRPVSGGSHLDREKVSASQEWRNTLKDNYLMRFEPAKKRPQSAPKAPPNRPPNRPKPTEIDPAFDLPIVIARRGRARPHLYPARCAFLIKIRQRAAREVGWGITNAGARREIERDFDSTRCAL
jgi:hypothetical protein